MSEQEITLEDGAQPRPLDVIEIGLTEWKPDGHQQENFVLDVNTRWRQVGRCTWRQAVQLPMLSDPLWASGSSTYNGINNFVPEEQGASLTDSLRLIRSQVAVHVLQNYYSNRPFEVWAYFQHAGQSYRLKVTDPIAEDRFRAQGIGDYMLGDSILTISLAEKWRGQFHKLVAAVVEKPDV